MNSEKSKRRLRFYLVLPVIVVPFVTVTFWMMGGGGEAVASVSTNRGFNMRLPDANVSRDSAKDKLSFYQQAASDSVTRESRLRNDPFSRPAVVVQEREVPVDVEMKLKEIRRRIETPASYDVQPRVVAGRAEVNKTPVEYRDPEIEAINQTIDKLMGLREHAAVKTEKPLSKRIVDEAGLIDSDDDSFFGRRDTTVRNRFASEKVIGGESFWATIPSTQTIQSGMLVKIQVDQAMKFKNGVVPAGTMVFGVAAIEGERMLVNIPTIRIDGAIIGTALSVFDLDGLEGVYVPGSMERDLIKVTTDQSLQSVNVLSLDPSLKSQAIGAGIGAAKGLLSKKVKAVRVTISAGYRVLLRNDKNY